MVLFSKVRTSKVQEHRPDIYIVLLFQKSCTEFKAEATKKINKYSGTKSSRNMSYVGKNWIYCVLQLNRTPAVLSCTCQSLELAKQKLLRVTLYGVPVLFSFLPSLACDLTNVSGYPPYNKGVTRRQSWCGTCGQFPWFIWSTCILEVSGLFDRVFTWDEHTGLLCAHKRSEFERTGVLRRSNIEPVLGSGSSVG